MNNEGTGNKKIGKKKQGTREQGTGINEKGVQKFMNLNYYLNKKGVSNETPNIQYLDFLLLILVP